MNFRPSPGWHGSLALRGIFRGTNQPPRGRRSWRCQIIPRDLELILSNLLRPLHKGRAKQKFVNRMKRIHGQVEVFGRSLSEGEPGTDILLQWAAV
jgi:hypothetical protein